MQESGRVKRTKCLSNWPSHHASLVPTGQLPPRGSTTLPIPDSRVEEGSAVAQIVEREVRMRLQQE